MPTLEEVLGSDLYAQVETKLKAHANDFKLANLADGQYVSKAKYDADLQAKDTRITELTDQVKKFDGVDIKKLQSEVTDWEKKYNEDIEKARIASAVQLAVAKSGTRSDKALIGMLDMSKVSINDKGEVTGLDDQIAAIRKDNAFLFEADPEPKKDVKLGGDHTGHGKDKIETLEDAVAAYYDEK
ncbi:MAG: phage scaffolding protein [Erysipelotrichaceae bacterium]|nr:phage scaffolding protein [Erysipelotrichaceae bacterium]